MKTKLFVFSGMLVFGSSFFAEAKQQSFKKEDKKSIILKQNQTRKKIFGAAFFAAIAFLGIRFGIRRINDIHRANQLAIVLNALEAR